MEDVISIVALTQKFVLVADPLLFFGDILSIDFKYYIKLCSVISSQNISFNI